MLPLRAHCKSERIRRLLPLGVVAAAALVPATAAQAEVTQTTVDSGPKSYIPLSLTSGSLPELQSMSGTAPGASDGDRVDVRCDQGGVLLPSVPVNNQKWSTESIIPFGFPVTLGGVLGNAPLSHGLGRMCNIRAVPAGTNPADPRPFAPRDAGLGRLDTLGGPLGATLSTGLLKNFEATSNQAGGAFQVASAGADGVRQSAKHYGSNFSRRTSGAFHGVGAFSGTNTGFGDPNIAISNTDGSNSRSAVLPMSQFGSPGGALGTGAVSVQRTLDAAGNMTLKESERAQQCKNILACLVNGYEDSGLKLDRTVTTSADGVTATVVDTWTNTSGVSHRYDLRYGNTIGDPGAGVGANDDVPLQKASHDTFVPGTSGPWSMVVNSDVNDPDVDNSDDHGALTYMNAPDIVVMEDGNDSEAWYQRTLAPGQSFTVTQVLDQAGTVAQARSLAAAHRAVPTQAAANAPASSGSSTPATLSSTNAKVAQAIAAALAKQSASKKSVAAYSASGAIRRSKSGKRYLRVKVNGPAGSVGINIAFLNKKGASVGSDSATVKTNKKVNLRSLDIPSKARKVKITVQ